MSIIPLASLLVLAAEQVALRTGDTIGGLLNTTFGNAPELIIGFVALQSGYIEMVRSALVGAIPQKGVFRSTDAGVGFESNTAKCR